MMPGPPYPGPRQGPPPPAPKRPVPVDVGTACQLWWGVIGVGIVNLIAAVTFLFGERKQFTEQLVEEMAKDNPNLPMQQDSANLLFALGLMTVVIIALALAVVAGLFVHFMREGRNWARMIVTMVGVVVIFVGVQLVFGIGTLDGPAAVVTGAASIIQAVLVVGATVLLHRQESNAYFLNFPPVNTR
jgi:hypothetical protein